MKAPRFKSWFARLPSLNQPQRRQVLDALHPAAGLAQVVALISQARAPGRCCPRCGNGRCHRHGFANDLQRFRCCACGRTFNDLKCLSPALQGLAIGLSWCCVTLSAQLSGLALGTGRQPG
jgi:hypothetical protein